MKKLIIANWKMNPQTPRQALRLAGAVARGIRGVKNVEVVLAPPFVFLPILSHLSPFMSRFSAKGGSAYGGKLAAQDIFYEKAGAFTGEISAPQLKTLGVKYVIIGHSERRALGETNEMTGKKILVALALNIKPVLCVGEKEKDADEVFPRIIREELREGLKNIKKSLLKNLIIAYEPIWAISGFRSSRADTPQNVYEMSILIKRELYRMLGKNVASLIPILYGGSVDDKNAADFIKGGAVDGLLVGGASLNVKKFVRIVKEAAKL